MKKQIQRLISAALIVCLLAVLAPAALAASDIDGHWAQAAMQDFIDSGYLTGYGNGQYGPNDEMTRAQYAALINRVTGLTQESSKIAGYTDVPSGAWYYSDLAKALAAGYMSGTSAATMSPNDPITREQAFTMVARLLGLTATEEDESALSRFSNLSDMSPYAKNAVAAMAASGYVSGAGNGLLLPRKHLTRAEGITILHNAADALRAMQAAGDGTGAGDSNDGVHTGTGGGGSSGGSGGSGGSRPTESESTYVNLWMNIPYADFYAAELNNETTVDAVSSATKNKTRTGGMMSGGSYHVNSDGTDITGVTFPVRMSQADFAKFKTGKTEVTGSSTVSITVTNRGQTSTTEYTGKDALFESPSYSYYVVPASETAPAYYKTATYEGDKLTFSATQGSSTALTGVTAELLTDTAYGDYQLNLTDAAAVENKTIYAIVLTAQDSTSYGLRHLENCWQYTKLAWSTGFTETVHGSPTAPNHYKSMMGKTITGVTYLTNEGKYTISLGNGVYVPVKFDGSVAVADASVSAGSTGAAVTLTNFPDDYSKTYAVTKDGKAATGFSVDGTTLTWTGTPAVGTYTLKVSDGSNKYASYSADFVLSTSENPVEYDSTGIALKAASGKSDDDLTAYISAITSVKVGETSYAASGRGAVTIINENGTIDLTAKSGQNAVFAELTQGKTYSATVTAAGYSTDLTFTITVPEKLYGTATLTYKEFYSGDVTSTDNYGVDGVSSATVSKYSIMSNMYTNWTEESEDGYNILGVKNVNVAVPAANLADYAAAAKDFVYTGAKAPEQYKSATVSGNTIDYSATQFKTAATVTDATATLATGSNWGDYQITVTESGSTKYLRNTRTDEGFAVNSAIQGVIIEAKKGEDDSETTVKVGMEYLQNIWVQPYMIAFNVSADSTHNAHIKTQDNIAQIAQLVGAKVTSITYIMQDGAYVYNFSEGIYIKPAYTSASGAQPVSATFTADSAEVAISNIPDVLTGVKVTITYGSGRNSTTVANALSVVQSNGLATVTMTANYDSTQTYTVKISSSNYADIVAEIPVSEAQKTQLEALINQTKALIDAGTVTENSDSGLMEHYKEAVEMQKDYAKASSAESAELISELTSHLSVYTGGSGGGQGSGKPATHAEEAAPEEAVSDVISAEEIPEESADDETSSDDVSEDEPAVESFPDEALPAEPSGADSSKDEND